jgi:hypothetical protein
MHYGGNLMLMAEAALEVYPKSRLQKQWREGLNLPYHAKVVK